jgi:hypothetical protein
LEPLIEQVSLDRKSITALGRIDRLNVPPGRHDIEIQYTAPSFHAAGKVRFRYRLNGFDAGWIEAGTRRVAYYNNLPPGRYRFEVIAANGDGIWSRATPALELRQKPQFHQTWGFLVLCATTFIAIVLLAAHLRVSHIRSGLAAILAERMQISREIHDTLAQGFAVGRRDMGCGANRGSPSSRDGARAIAGKSRAGKGIHARVTVGFGVWG